MSDSSRTAYLGVCQVGYVIYAHGCLIPANAAHRYFLEGDHQHKRHGGLPIRHLPIARLGMTAAPEPWTRLSAVALIVPLNSLHGPLSPVGVIGEGSSAVLQASESTTSPTACSATRERGRPNALTDKLKECARGVMRSVRCFCRALTELEMMNREIKILLVQCKVQNKKDNQKTRTCFLRSDGSRRRSHPRAMR